MGSKVVAVVALLALGAAATTYLLRASGPAATEAASPNVAAPESRLERGPVLESPQRAPAADPIVEPAPRAEPPPIAPELPKVVAVDVGDRSTWPAEFANHSIPELEAEAKRLREELDKEIDAEFERRYREGPYESFAPGIPPPSAQGATVRYERGRLEGDVYKRVTLDEASAPELLRKEDKWLWLTGEIWRRRQ